MSSKKIVVIGGGNGIQSVLRGVTGKNVEISAIVSMFDSGGSTGKLRKDLNIPAVGDIRRVLIAMRNPSRQTDILKEIFEFRFKKGEFKGHNLGNIILAALLQGSRNAVDAWNKAAKLFDVRGQVYPVTMANSHLVAELENGQIIKGETNIDIPKKSGRDPKLKIKRLFSMPHVSASRGAIKAIEKANLIIIGPGDLYTSIIANFTSSGLAKAIQKSRGKTAYICNILEKPGETLGMSASEHANEILKYTGIKKLDYILVNDSKGRGTVKNDIAKLKNIGRKIISADFTSNEAGKHDPKVLGKYLNTI